MALGRSATPEDAGDATEQVFERLIVTGRWKGIASPQDFLRTATFWEAARIRRAARPYTRLPAPLADQLSSHAPTPEDIAAREEARRIVREHVDELPERCAAVMKLWLERHTHREIAEILGIGVGAVEKQVARARKLVGQGLKRRWRKWSGLSTFEDGGGWRVEGSYLNGRAIK